VASRAAKILGDTILSQRLNLAFLTFWGNSRADLYESSVWRQRVKKSKQLAQITQEEGPILYSKVAKVGILTRTPSPQLQQVENILSQALKWRYTVLILSKASAQLDHPDERWLKGLAPLPQTVQALVVIEQPPEEKTLIQLIRLDSSTKKEVSRTTLDLPLSPEKVTKAALAIFPRSTNALYYGELVADLFQQCTYCFRRLTSGELIETAGAELELAFSGTGRILPSRVTKVVPSSKELTICIRNCVEQLSLPPFGQHPKDRLDVTLFASIGSEWALLRSVPKLQLAP
jgi:hypothetical protein